jgi:hypothetical protein
MEYCRRPVGTVTDPSALFRPFATATISAAPSMHRNAVVILKTRYNHSKTPKPVNTGFSHFVRMSKFGKVLKQPKFRPSSTIRLLRRGCKIVFLMQPGKLLPNRRSVDLPPFRNPLERMKPMIFVTFLGYSGHFVHTTALAIILLRMVCSWPHRTRAIVSTSKSVMIARLQSFSDINVYGTTRLKWIHSFV